MSLVGICWNMMAFSIFPKKSVFRKIIITEKNLPSVSNTTKSIGFSLCFCTFATKEAKTFTADFRKKPRLVSDGI